MVHCTNLGEAKGLMSIGGIHLVRLNLKVDDSEPNLILITVTRESATRKAYEIVRLTLTVVFAVCFDRCVLLKSE